MKWPWILSSLLLAACASTDPYSFTYKEMSEQSRVVMLPDPGANPSILVLRREPGWTGAAGTHSFTLDGRKLVELEQGEQKTFQIPPGQYVLGTHCQMAPFSPVVNETALTALAGRTYFFREYAVAGAGGGVCLIAPMNR